MARLGIGLGIWLGLGLGLRLDQRQEAVLSQGGLRDAAVDFGTYRSSQWRRVGFTAIAKTMLSN